MSSNVIEWARTKLLELEGPSPDRKHFPVESLQEGMLVRGAISRWQISVSEPDWYKEYRGDNYAAVVDDIYLLLSREGEKWMTLTPEDGVQYLSAWQFCSIDSIPFTRTEEEWAEEIERYNEWQLGGLPGLDYEEAS